MRQPPNRVSSPRPFSRTPSGNTRESPSCRRISSGQTPRRSSTLLPFPATSRAGPLPAHDYPYQCSQLYENIFNVPFAASIALTHSIEIHGEVIPRLSKVNSSGVAWSVTVEKSLLRHRFAFYAGNYRQTTVDRYIQAVPYGFPPKNVYIGFNLLRAWNLK